MRVLIVTRLLVIVLHCNHIPRSGVAGADLGAAVARMCPSSLEIGLLCMRYLRLINCARERCPFLVN